MTFFKSLDKIKFRVHEREEKNKEFLKKIIEIGALISIFIYTFKDSTIYTSLIYLTSNLENSNIFPSKIEIVKNMYPVFNENNYIFDEITNEVTEEVKIEQELQEEPLVIDNVDYGEIDNIDKYEAKNFFNSIGAMQVNISQGPGYEYVRIGEKIEIRDFSDLPNIPYSEIMQRNITLTKSNDKIFIYNTHASETYTRSELFNFEYTGNYRTTDSNYNMISVAKRLTTFLKEKNISVIEDEQGHDYGSYTMSYASSGASVLKHIEESGKFGISMDIHRDAIEDLSFSPKVNIGGTQVAQLMIVLGIGYDGDRNPYYQDNMNLAIKLMELGNKVYPGLFRPMILRNSTYNQHLNDYSLLIEVGATGNTLEEAYRAMRCLSNLLDIIYID